MLFIAAAIVVIAAVVSPVDVSVARTGEGPERLQRTPSPDIEDRVKPSPLSFYQSLWALDLRRPLYDPPKPSPIVPAPPPPPPPLAVRLVGTLVETTSPRAGASDNVETTPASPDPSSVKSDGQAMFMTGKGQIEIKRVGEIVGEAPGDAGAKVLAIRNNAVTVLHHGRHLELKVEESK